MLKTGGSYLKMLTHEYLWTTTSAHGQSDALVLRPLPKDDNIVAKHRRTSSPRTRLAGSRLSSKGSSAWAMARRRTSWTTSRRSRIGNRLQSSQSSSASTARQGKQCPGTWRIGARTFSRSSRVLIERRSTTVSLILIIANMLWMVKRAML